jgi:recombinational DNA repair protein (RecF pathway)
MSSTLPALVLRKEPSGESFLKLHLLDPENGLQLCLKRVSSKGSSKKPQPDLFDTAEVRIDLSKQGSTAFVAEYRVMQRRTNIGLNYSRLCYASDFANLLILNGTHMADLGALYNLAARSLDAFSERNSPSVVFLKSLYLLLKDEGYPVRESWWHQLPSELRELTRDLIQQPSPDQLTPQAKAACEATIRHLLLWIRRETEFSLPTTHEG